MAGDGQATGIYTDLGLRRRSIHGDACGIELVVVQTIRVVDDLLFCEAMDANLGLCSGDLYLKFGVSLSEIRTRWIHTVVLEIL